MDEYGDLHHNLRYWISRLVDAVRPDPLVVYDIGANDGELTLPFARAPHRVVAFEPGPAARERLRRRAGEIEGGSALTVIPCALGATSGEAVLQIYSDDTFSSLHARPEKDMTRYKLEVTRTVRVPVVPLDALTGGGEASGGREQALSGTTTGLMPPGSTLPLPPPDLVKIDVEGAERDVLLGALGTLRAHRPAVIMEYSCINTENAGYPRELLLELLREAGYGEIFGLFRNEDLRLYGGVALESCRIWNILAIPPRFAGARSEQEIIRAVPD
jgi:FkbM family methyltransferase